MLFPPVLALFQYARTPLPGPLLKQIWGDGDSGRMLTVWLNILRFLGDLPSRGEDPLSNLQKVRIACCVVVVVVVVMMREEDLRLLLTALILVSFASRCISSATSHWPGPTRATRFTAKF